MSDFDDLFDRIDVDAALGDVIARHACDVRRRRRQHASLAVAVAALVLLAGAVAWPRASGDTPVDVAGTDGPASTSTTRSVIGPDGLIVTVAIDQDQVSVGDRVGVTVTLDNQGSASFSGAWADPFRCSASVGAAVRVLDGDRPMAVGNIASGDAGWIGSRAGLAEQAASDPELIAAGIWSDPSVVLPICPENPSGPSVERLDPGQVRTVTGTWPVWLGAGEIPDPATLQLEVIVSVYDCEGCQDVTFLRSAACATCARTEVARIEVPIALDASSRTAPPSAEARRAALEHPDARTLADGLEPLVGDQPDLLGLWLMQTGPTWTQRVIGLDSAFDIEFDGNGDVASVRPIGAAAGPPCSTTAAIIEAGRESLRSSPLAATIDRVSPGTLTALGIAEGKLITEGRVLAVRPVGSVVVPGADGMPDAPGGPLAWSGVEVVVSTEAGEVTVPVALAMGGVPVMEANRPSTEALEALVGACVVVQHGTGDGVPPLGQGSPRILAVATDPASAPVALDHFYDPVLSGFATPAELVLALRETQAVAPPR